jgi:hypothetical protein
MNGHGKDDALIQQMSLIHDERIDVKEDISGV